MNPVADLPLLPACIWEVLYVRARDFVKVAIAKAVFWFAESGCAGNQPREVRTRCGWRFAHSRAPLSRKGGASGLKLDWRPDSKEGVRTESQRGPRRLRGTLCDLV